MATDTVPKTENFNLANGEEDVICPSCDAKIKRSQVADHCQIEMERLHNMQLRSTQSAHATAVAAAPATTTTQTEPAAPEVGGQRRPWSVFQRVQRNRQTRQRQRTRKRPTPPPAAPTSASAPASSSASASTAAANSSSSCPVCNKSFAQPEIQEHVNQCLRASQRSNGERHSSDDDEDSDEYEEYEWAGQKRIRVSSLVQGGYAALNLGQTIKYNGSQQQQVGNEDEDDVNVDEDDTHIYGPTQYGEEDVIPLADDDDTATPSGGVSEAEVTSYVRRLISSNETPKSNSNPPAKHSSETTEQMDDTAVSLAPSTSGHQSATAPSTSRSSNNCSSASAMQQQLQIIESLKARLRLYEKQAQSKLKCLICIDDYKNPAISVSCWHVHCEQCWLQTLGARKLCPQCNSITTPKDLRRIYL